VHAFPIRIVERMNAAARSTLAGSAQDSGGKRGERVDRAEQRERVDRAEQSRLRKPFGVRITKRREIRLARLVQRMRT
jgi:hypothetical protein